MPLLSNKDFQAKLIDASRLRYLIESFYRIGLGLRLASHALLCTAHYRQVQLLVTGDDAFYRFVWRLKRSPWASSEARSHGWVKTLVEAVFVKMSSVSKPLERFKTVLKTDGGKRNKNSLTKQYTSCPIHRHDAKVGS